MVANTRKKKRYESKDELVNTINENYDLAKAYWDPIHLQINSNKRFLNGDQWTQSVKTLRARDGRPTVTVPRLSNFVRQLQTQIRQTNNIVEVSANNNASEQDCIIVNGLINRAQAKSNSETVYDNAAYDAIVGGIGFVRVFSDYPEYASFDQEIYIEHIYDPTTVYFDPNSTASLFEDAGYCLIESVMSREEYVAKIGKSKVTDIEKISGWKKASPLVLDDDHIIILEYYWKEHTSKPIYKVGNNITGEVFISDKLPDDEMTYTVIEKRSIPECKVYHCLFDGVEVHNKTTIDAKSIPVVPVMGEQTFIDRKRFIKGAITDAIDTQIILNYTASTQLELLDLSPRSPWLVTPKAVEGYENEWAEANTRNYSYLVYNDNAPAPQRMPANADIGPVQSVKQQAENDLQAIFGIFDAQLGAPSNEISGTAINARVRQGNNSTFVYKDNLAKSIKQVGKILSEMIPFVYNGRTEVIPLINGTDARVQVNVNPLSSFEIALTERPNDESAKEQLNSELIKISQILPSAAPLLADYMIKNSDLPGADELVARLSTLLPPEVRMIEAANKQNDPKQAQAMLMQKTQETEQLNAAMQQIQMQLQQLQMENQQLKNNKDIEQQKIQLDAAKAKNEYELKSKELLLEKTQMELDWAIASQQQKLKEAQLAVEATSGQNISDVGESPNIG